MRFLVALVALMFIPGCAHWFGPAHGLVEVVGSTPVDASCELTLAPVGESGPAPRTVAGQFREEFMVSYSRKGHRAQLTCDGSIVSERTFKYGPDVSFGGDVLLNENAP